jgi:hypothetical protein
MPETTEELEGGICAAPWTVMHLVYEWFRDRGEWPTPFQIHAHLADWSGCPMEVASYDTDNARTHGYVYAVPTVVAMRHGEVPGDWKAMPLVLPDGDNGFRIAVDEKWWHGPFGSGCCDDVYRQRKAYVTWSNYLRAEQKAS